MAQFPIHSEDNHPEKSAEVLAKTKAKYGFVPNLLGALSEAPAAADAYMSLGAAVGQTSFTDEERHVAWFTINTYHGCDYCMAANTPMPKGQGISDAVIETARNGGDYEDSRFQALKVFSIAMLDDRGWVKPEAIEAFLAAGFTQQHVLELVVIIAHKTLSNYTNHLVHTPLDDKFKPFEWAPAKQAAE